jgi:hypothetical protein
MSTEANDHFDLQLVPEWRHGRLRLQAVVRHGDDVVVSDNIDPGSSRSRAGLTRQIQEQAQARGVQFDRDAFDLLVLQQATQAQAVPDGPRASTTSVNHRELLDALGIDVLGERDDQSIVCWIRRTQKRWEIKSPAKWAPEEMLQALGERGEELLWLEPGLAPPNMFTPQELRRAVAIAASDASRLVDTGMYGQGIWREQAEFIILNGADAHRYDGEHFEPIIHPRWGQKIIDFNACGRWAENFPLAVASINNDVARQLLTTLENLLGLWNWAHPQDHCVQAALIAATFVQTCWRWRPLNSITGPSDAGKSTLLQELLVPLYGDWAIMADRSTEAGLRQAIGHHAAPVIIDEFDKYRQRQQVLELFRTSSRGGRILRGTQDQQGQSFGLKHLAHFAAIESGDIWGQDRNRFIRGELGLPLHRGRLVLPSPNELHTLGQQVAAAALWAAPAAVRLADAIKSTRIDGVHGRLVESFAVPAAMSAVLTHGRDVCEVVAAEVLQRMILGREVLQAQGEPDEYRLLNDILSAKVRVPDRRNSEGPAAEQPVAQVLVESLAARAPLALRAAQLEQALGNRGLRLVTTNSGAALFVAYQIVRQELLRDTRWADTCIDQLLVRLPGARRCQQRCGGQRPWGVTVPIRGCLDRLLALDGPQDSVNAGAEGS